MISLDFTQDILVFDSDSDPKVVHLFQVKTDDGNWTIARLTAKKSKKASIVAKLYAAAETFHGHDSLIYFVSTSALGNDCFMQGDATLFDDKSHSVATFVCPSWLPEGPYTACLGQLPSNVVDAFETSLRQELSLKALNNLSSRLIFVQTKLTPLTHDDVVASELVKYLSKVNAYFPIAAFQNAVEGELRRKNDNELPVATYEQLRERKSITREQFQSYIDSHNPAPASEANWNLAHQILSSQGITTSELISIRMAWAKYQVHRIAAPSPSHRLLRERLQSVIANHPDLLSDTDLIQMANIAQDDQVIKTLNFPVPYIQAATVMEMFYAESQLPTVSAQSKETT